MAMTGTPGLAAIEGKGSKLEQTLNDAKKFFEDPDCMQLNLLKKVAGMI